MSEISNNSWFNVNIEFLGKSVEEVKNIFELVFANRCNVNSVTACSLPESQISNPTFKSRASENSSPISTNTAPESSKSGTSEKPGSKSLESRNVPKTEPSEPNQKFDGIPMAASGSSALPNASTTVFPKTHSNYPIPQVSEAAHAPLLTPKTEYDENAAHCSSAAPEVQIQPTVTPMIAPKTEEGLAVKCEAASIDTMTSQHIRQKEPSNRCDLGNRKRKMNEIDDVVPKKSFNPNNSFSHIPEAVRCGEKVGNKQTALFQLTTPSAPQCFRIMLVNYESFRSKCHGFIQNHQSKYGYSFKTAKSAPETFLLYALKSQWVTSFTIYSSEEFRKIRENIEEQKKNGVGWTQKFSIFNMKESNPFIWLEPLSIEEILQAVLVSTKTTIDRKNGISNEEMDMKSAINSEIELEKALSCTETMEKLEENLCKRGKKALKEIGRNVRDGVFRN